MTVDVCDIFRCEDCPYYGPDCEKTIKWLSEHGIDEEEGYE